MEKYVFEESLNRISETMTYSYPLTQESIPNVEGISEKQPCFVNATVVYVIVEASEDSPQVMQSFLAEASKIAKAHENCKDVICVEDRLVFIYSSAYKAELGNALDDAARVRSLAMVVSRIGRQRGFGSVKVKIGMDYGLMEMYMMGKDENGSPRYAWRGQALRKAKENAEYAHDEIIITRVVWNNLSENNQKLFSMQSVLTENYRGQIINVMMNNWLNKAL
jgi:hypothetical protein